MAYPVLEDLVPAHLPPVFRIVKIEATPTADGRSVTTTAVIFHERATLRVVWTSRQADNRLQRGRLVSLGWKGAAHVCGDGAIVIARLLPINKPISSVNLFDTVPPTWVKDRGLVARARTLVDLLSPSLAHLLNAVLWDGRRFHRYVIGPSSIAGHHADSNGNLRHSIEVAETCLSLAVADTTACRSVLMLAALLHDAGKAEEYEYDPARRCFTMSPRGALVGHKHTLLEWIAAARAEHRVAMPEAHYLALVHCLTAAKGPDYLGLRPPLTREATLLSAADRLSGHADLIAQTAPPTEGFGKYHKHLGGRAFVVTDTDPILPPQMVPQPSLAGPLPGP